MNRIPIQIRMKIDQNDKRRNSHKKRNFLRKKKCIHEK